MPPNQISVTLLREKETPRPIAEDKSNLTKQEIATPEVPPAWSNPAKQKRNKNRKTVPATNAERAASAPLTMKGAGKNREEDRAPKAQVNLNINLGDLWEIAGQDPRIQRMKQDRQKPKTFERERLTLYNIPKEAHHREIRSILEASWNPDWKDLHDESLSEVSLPWVKRGLKNWLRSWQDSIKNQGAKIEGMSEEHLMVLQKKADPEAASSRTSVEIDLEPLPDGSWAASISKSSDHPFFDQTALREAQEAAKIFPSWKEGHGSLLRYRLDAKFVIVPPSPSSLLGLSCAFPFCTPEELKELELYYWFKKVIRKQIRFMGMVRAPPKKPNQTENENNNRLIIAD